MSEAQTIERKRAIRKANRGVITKYINEANDLLKEEEFDQDRLSTIQGLLREKLDYIKRIDSEILEICEIKDIEKEIIEAEEINTRVLNISKKILKLTTPTSEGQLLNTTQHENITVETEQFEQQIEQQNESVAVDSVLNNSASQASISSTGQVQQNQVSQHYVTKSKLPKLVLPKFKGDLTKFRSFWDSYESAVHKNSQLSTIDKFNYLNSLLEGQALRSIQGLSLTEDNYQAAVDLLNQRFGNQQQIISAHMDELLKIPVCSNDKSSQLRFVYDKISVSVRGLEALGVNSSQYGSLLIPIIMSKLPSQIRLQIARNTADEVWKITDLLEVMRKEVEARELSENVRSGESDNRKSETRDEIDNFRKLNQRNKNKHQVSAANLFVKDDETNETKPKCVYCGEFHFSASCTRVKDPSKRKDILTKDKRCYSCLKTGHITRDCRKPQNCRLCEGRHHQSICQRSANSKKSENKDDSNGDGNQEQNHATTATNGKSSKVLLQTATTFAYSSQRSTTVPVRVLMDSGSQRTYVTDGLKEKLGLQPTKTETLKLNTFGGDRFSKKRCDVVQLSLQGSDGDVEISAVCFPKICSPIPTKICPERYSHLNGLNLADSNLIESEEPEHDNIDILIGCDYYFDIVNNEMIRGEKGSPVAVGSKFGYIVSGPVGREDTIDETSMVHLITEAYQLPVSKSPHIGNNDDNLIETLRTFWDTESIGITNHDTESPEENKFLREVSFDKLGGRYQVGLPWKAEVLPQSNGYLTCVRRLRQLHFHLKKDKCLLNDYDSVIKQQLDCGIIEAVPEDDDNSAGSYYLPHHGVIREDKETTKLRVVFDGSAKPSDDSPSINECLEKGPNLVPNLLDTVLKFRSHPIGIVADIEKAFHQIQILPDDRRMLRFLWFDDVAEPVPEIREFQFCRLVFGLTPSPAVLASVIQHHLTTHKETNPEMVSLLNDSFYVDDFAGGAKTDDDAVEVYQRSQEIMKDGGFTLRKWMSNSKKFRETVAKNEEQQLFKNTNKPSINQESDCVTSSSSSNEIVKVLGLHWNVDSDEFQFDPTELIEYALTLPPTKRSVLKLSAKIFDPIGILAPFTVNLKCLFQTLCVDNVNWDTELSGKSLSTWNSLLKDLIAIKSISASRCYFTRSSPISNHQIHGFSDASGKAYSAVVYLRTEYQDGTIEVNLVSSKTRVAPLKRQSIPRLELLGANVLARLVNTVMKALSSLIKDPEVFLWTDSSTTLCWITNHKIWKQYVNRRVTEIRQLTNEKDWRFCPGELNPADLPSRGCTATALAENETWLTGPDFLKDPYEKWPQCPHSTNFVDDVALSEAVQTHPTVTHSLTNLTDNPRSRARIGLVMECNEYSSVTRLLRITSLVLRFIKKLRGQKTKTDLMFLSANDLKEAEVLWIREVQEVSFPEVSRLLQSKHRVKHQLIDQLNLFRDKNNLIRCEGRLEHSSLSSDSNNPILLPSRHPFTELIIRDRHVNVHHCGINDTLNCVRGTYWILRGRESVKRVLKKCVTCKRHDGKPFPTPKIPALPPSRVSEEPPFTYTGLDFAGPLFVRDGETTEKSYIGLYTCASTRAIHLELLKNLTTDAFLQSFRRFTSRRGLPKKLISDNAKTFKAAAKQIEKIKRSRDIQCFLTNKGVDWDFITEKAPWHGGFWERLVKSTKRCLKKSVGKALLSYEEMRTMLVEVEATLNNRPITYIYDDEEGVSFPLTPSCLIYGRRIATTPNDSQFEISSTNQSLTRRAKHQNRVLKNFTKQWSKDYLLSLRESSKAQPKGVEKISVGDIVVLKNDSTARVFWKLAKVEELIPSRDKIVRSAKVSVLNEAKKKIQLRRPIQHLVPLEVNQKDVV